MRWAAWVRRQSWRSFLRLLNSSIPPREGRGMLHDNAKGYRYEPTRRHERPARARTPRRVAGARSVLLVFAINVQCAASFVLWPRCLRTVVRGGRACPGAAAVQGLGIAFLMWNAHLPRRHRQPAALPRRGRHRAGAAGHRPCGESWLRFGLPAGHAALSASIERFILFDAAGLVLMAAAFGWLLWVKRATPQT